MRELRVEAFGAIVAFAITLAFTLYPVPYLMGAFTFVAQPLFGIVALLYIWRVLRELMRKDVF